MKNAVTVKIFLCCLIASLFFACTLPSRAAGRNSPSQEYEDEYDPQTDGLTGVRHLWEHVRQSSDGRFGIMTLWNAVQTIYRAVTEDETDWMGLINELPPELGEVFLEVVQCSKCRDAFRDGISGLWPRGGDSPQKPEPRQSRQKLPPPENPKQPNMSQPDAKKERQLALERWSTDVWESVRRANHESRPLAGIFEAQWPTSGRVQIGRALPELRADAKTSSALAGRTVNIYEEDAEFYITSKSAVQNAVDTLLRGRVSYFAGNDYFTITPAAEWDELEAAFRTAVLRPCSEDASGEGDFSRDSQALAAVRTHLEKSGGTANAALAFVFPMGEKVWQAVFADVQSALGVRVRKRLILIGDLFSAPRDGVEEWLSARVSRYAEQAPCVSDSQGRMMCVFRSQTKTALAGVRTEEKMKQLFGDALLETFPGWNADSAK